MGYAAAITESRLLRFAQWAFLVWMVVVVAYMAARPSPPGPDKRKAYGCYSAAGAPPILLNESGLRILQSPLLQTRFNLEKMKDGLALVVTPTIAAEPIGDGYRFQRGKTGILRFINVIEGRAYGVVDEDALRRFDMITEDGVRLVYQRTILAACRGVS